MTTVLILGSGPNVLDARAWPRARFDHILAINNAFAVRPDWDSLIHPEDFDPDRLPQHLEAGQSIVTAADYVPAQNAYGGFVYAGGTMAFTAGYWALAHHRPTCLAFMGCDMTYPPGGETHFYGTGAADPLRDDITLQSLEAKSARLEILAAKQGCAAVNLSQDDSRLVFPRGDAFTLGDKAPRRFDDAAVRAALQREETLGYLAPSGRYWEALDRFDPAALADLDALWLAAAGSSRDT
ncbi:hypothetical protein [uncultured Litoreibacter sp.]|uniref:hypothetical protein n=1 Tax=uncultured Litoreibacter sp. TaxID=1392394 RepID=UPI002637E948|nr:hypothetical protein [uncultured Litoreibacter sp.]